MCMSVCLSAKWTRSSPMRWISLKWFTKPVREIDHNCIHICYYMYRIFNGWKTQYSVCPSGFNRSLCQILLVFFCVGNKQLDFKRNFKQEGSLCYGMVNGGNLCTMLIAKHRHLSTLNWLVTSKPNRFASN